MDSAAISTLRMEVSAMRAEMRAVGAYIKEERKRREEDEERTAALVAAMAKMGDWLAKLEEKEEKKKERVVNCPAPQVVKQGELADESLWELRWSSIRIPPTAQALMIWGYSVGGLQAGVLYLLAFLADPFTTVFLVGAFVLLHLIARFETSRIGRMLMGPRPVGGEVVAPSAAALGVQPPVIEASVQVDPPASEVGAVGSWVPSFVSNWLGFGGSEAVLPGGASRTAGAELGPASQVVVALEGLLPAGPHPLSQRSDFPLGMLRVRP
jgi:hypothetical protein